MMTTSTKREYVVNTRNTDVLCGHGLSNLGNAIFRCAVADNARQYKDCRSTASKKEIVRNITDSIRKMGCRFLKEVPEETAKRLGAKVQIWYVLGWGQCTDEVEGALRGACMEEVRSDSSLQKSKSYTDCTESANMERSTLIAEERAGSLPQDPRTATTTVTISITTTTTTTERIVPKWNESIPPGTGAVAAASSVGMLGPKAAFIKRKPAQSVSAATAATPQTVQSSPIPFSPTTGRTVPKRRRVSRKIPNSRAAFGEERNVLHPLSCRREQKKTGFVDRVGGVGRRATPVGRHMQVYRQFEDPEWPKAGKTKHKKRALPAATDGEPSYCIGTTGTSGKQSIRTEVVPWEVDSRKHPGSVTKANPRQNDSLFAAVTSLANRPRRDTNENAAAFFNPTPDRIDHALPEDLTTTPRRQHDHRTIPPRVVDCQVPLAVDLDPVLSCALPSMARTDIGNDEELRTRQRKALVRDLPNNDDQPRSTTTATTGAMLPPVSPLVTPTTHDKAFQSQSKQESAIAGEEVSQNHRDSHLDKKDCKQCSDSLPHTMTQESHVNARSVAIASSGNDEALENEEIGMSMLFSEKVEEVPPPLFMPKEAPG